MISDERFKSILKHAAEYLNFKRWTYDTRDYNSVTIENYFGILIRATIIENGDNRARKPVFIKIPPTNMNEQLKDNIHRMYEVEAYTYSTLLPIYRSISNVETDKFIPECYYSNMAENNEVLVLQDMTCSGYLRYEGKTLDFDHVVTSLKALARFHSLSVILKEKGFGLDSDIMKPYTDLHPKMYYKHMKQSVESHVKILKDTKYEIYVYRIAKDLSSHTCRCTNEAIYLVYGHGDFWRENILFKYKNNKPIEACLIDFQKSRKMSAALDILLFLLTNEAAINREHHQHFLGVYLQELHHNLKENGIDNVYSYEDLDRDMKVVAPYAVASSILSYSLWLGLEDGDIVKSKYTCNSDYKSMMLLSFKTQVIDMLEYLSDFDYISI